MKIISKTPIHKGWSKDKKYKIIDEKDNPFLLRVSSLDTLEKKKAEWAFTNALASLNLPMNRPVSFLVNDNEVHTIYSWIDGEDAEQVLLTLSEKEQYGMGVHAGHTLKNIHSIPAPGNHEPWEDFFTRKMNRKVDQYNGCPVHYDKAHLFLHYIEENHSLIKHRPQCFQHGDYHIGNMMIDRNRKLQVIDFSSFDIGDPWQEFDRIVWCAQKAPAFAKGRIDGYFDDAPPKEFWDLLLLYISSNMLSSFPWALTFGEDEVEKFKNQADDILAWFDNLNHPIPTWYSRKINF